MVIEKTDNDILYFLIKAEKKEWTVLDLSQKLLIPKNLLLGMLTRLKMKGFIKTRLDAFNRYYSLINS